MNTMNTMLTGNGRNEKYMTHYQDYRVRGAGLSGKELGFPPLPEEKLRHFKGVPYAMGQVIIDLHGVSVPCYSGIWRETTSSICPWFQIYKDTGEVGYMCEFLKDMPKEEIWELLNAILDYRIAEKLKS